MMNVVDPSPSSDTAPARIAVPSTTFAGSSPSRRVITRISGSKRPTSIMMPKYMIANMSSAAVGAMELIASITMSPSPRPAPAKSPKIVGTTMSATMGVSRRVMMSAMNVRIIANPRITRMVSDGTNATA
ncbi:MAG: hypothetical protein K0Q58_1437 [Microbacterium sp.]|nr:hypothetical protein [Microbacterium sp.]